MKQKVLLGMSGGVDSSVSAILLQNQGYEVIGCTMKLHNAESDKAILDAKNVCEKLNIQHYVLDAQKEFSCYVISKFVEEYKNARTPNPCIECNKHLKFGYLFEKAKEFNCDYIATGHYAQKIFSEKYNRYVLKQSKEENKDQTYFLYSIPKKKIEHILFPLQEYSNKKEIREIAKENDLAVSEKKDSQEICFIPNNNYKDFLNKKIPNKEGNIILENGQVLGRHNGLVNYTIGQRKGLGIAYKEPLYVIKLDITKNEVIVGNEKSLYSKELYAKNCNWFIFDKLENEITCYAKVRYRAKKAKVKVYNKDGKVKVEFFTFQRAITPGQSVVFYDEDGIMLGGGIIDNF